MKTGYAKAYGIDPTAPVCPRCGRHVPIISGTRLGNFVRHKNPETMRWCKAPHPEARS